VEEAPPVPFIVGAVKMHEAWRDGSLFPLFPNRNIRCSRTLQDLPSIRSSARALENRKHCASSRVSVPGKSWVNLRASTIRGIQDRRYPFLGSLSA
jgi:hypothetical protein